MEERLRSLLSVFPKLEREYNKLQNLNYKVSGIDSSSSFYTQFEHNELRITMEDHSGKRVLLTGFSEGNCKEVVYIDEIAHKTDVIYPWLRLNSKAIFNKTFKRSLFRGYNMHAVNSFLDTIMYDYKYLEEHLSNKTTDGE